MSTLVMENTFQHIQVEGCTEKSPNLSAYHIFFETIYTIIAPSQFASNSIGKQIQRKKSVALLW